MALFTSAKGYFEVTAVSFAPNVITVGEETSFSVTIKNVSGKKITSMYACMGLYYPDAADRVSRSTDVYIYGGPSYEMVSISWAANASKTFTGTFKFTTSSYYTYLPNITTRLMPLFDATSSTGGSKRGMMIQLVTDATFADGTNHDNIYDIRGENSEYLAVIDARYNPAITIFAADRCMDGVLNDEGENIMVDLTLSLPDTAIMDGFTLKFYYAQDADATTSSTSIDLTDSITSALSGITDSTTLITQTFDKAVDWGLMIAFGDDYESTVARIDLARSFANMHLSGHDTGGVCFGGFSTSEEDNPKLESYYPFYPYGGIEPIETAYPAVSSGVCTPGSYGGTLVFRRIGNLAIISGSIALTTAAATVQICSIPNNFIPTSSHYYIAAMTGSQIARLVVYGSDDNANYPGYLTLEWVKKMSSTSSVSSTQAWIDCSTVYWIN